MKGVGSLLGASPVEDHMAARSASGVLAPSVADVWRAMRAHTGPLLIERMRTALLLSSVSLTFFLLQDLFFFRHLVVRLVLLKCSQFAVVGVSLWLIHTRRLPRNVVAFAV